MNTRALEFIAAVLASWDLAVWFIKTAFNVVAGN